MKLKLIKFRHGEEVLVELWNETEDTIFIKNGAMLMPMENFQWHLMTWLPYTNAKDGLTLNKQDLLFITDLSDDMASYHKNWKEALSKKVNTN